LRSYSERVARGTLDAVQDLAQDGDAAGVGRAVDRGADLLGGEAVAVGHLGDVVLEHERGDAAGAVEDGAGGGGHWQPVAGRDVLGVQRGDAVQPEPRAVVRVAPQEHDVHDRRLLLEGVPRRGGRCVAQQGVGAQVQQRGVRESEALGPGTPDQVDVAPDRVQPAAPDAARDRPSAQPRGQQLVAMNVAALTLRDPHDLGVAAPAHVLKRTNHPRQR
jgi:hypothetical protein